MRKLCVSAIVLLASTVGAIAQIGGNVPLTRAGVTFDGKYLGPTDVVTSAILDFWSCSRSINNTNAVVASVLCELTRQSDLHTCDVITAQSGAAQPDVALCGTAYDSNQPISQFCAGTTCNITDIVDQINTTGCTAGGACDLVQATVANQPTLTQLGCPGLATTCVEFNRGASTTHFLQSANYTPTITQNSFYFGVAKPVTTVAGTVGQIFGENQGSLAIYLDTNPLAWLFQASSVGTSITLATVVRGVWTFLAAFENTGFKGPLFANNTSSPFVSGTVVTITNAAMGNNVFSNAFQGTIAEMGFYRLAPTTSQIITLCKNASSFYRIASGC